MTTNKHYKRFTSILSTINLKGISTAEELCAPCNEGIYAELWLAAQNFINYFALASKSHRNSKGEYVKGNADKVRTLVSHGLDLEDIRGDILVHILSKMNRILSQPPEKQANYVYKTINNCIYSQLRKLSPADVVVVSLQDKVKRSDASGENASEIQDFIADFNTPEDEIVAKETVNEIFMNKRAEVLNEITFLANKPTEVFVRLCSKHLGMKPAAIAELLLKKGVTTSFSMVLMFVSDKFDISLGEIYNHLTNKAITEESVKLDTNDKTQISAQISRLVYRADRRLSKQIKS